MQGTWWQKWQYNIQDWEYYIDRSDNNIINHIDPRQCHRNDTLIPILTLYMSNYIDRSNNNTINHIDPRHCHRNDTLIPILTLYMSNLLVTYIDTLFSNMASDWLVAELSANRKPYKKICTGDKQRQFIAIMLEWLHLSSISYKGYRGPSQ